MLTYLRICIISKNLLNGANLPGLFLWFYSFCGHISNVQQSDVPSFHLLCHFGCCSAAKSEPSLHLCAEAFRILKHFTISSNWLQMLIFAILKESWKVDEWGWPHLIRLLKRAISEKLREKKKLSEILLSLNPSVSATKFKKISLFLSDFAWFITESDHSTFFDDENSDN